jgi:two-component system phosphate regulon response regulator PhoB
LATEPDLQVLLIEDDPAVAEMYRYRLEIDGYTVTVAPDGESGLALALETQPDLVYLDLKLPGTDGLSVLEKLRAQEATRTLPVVILTNYDEPELIERSRQMGALEFLVKAETSPGALTKRMADWLQHERLSRHQAAAAGEGSA